MKKNNQNKKYYISTEKDKLEIDFIHYFLNNDTHWGIGMSREIVEAAIQNSFCFGLYKKSNNKQVGFARVITDFAAYGNLQDVYIIPKLRGKGLANFLLDTIVNHPKLIGLRRFSLATRNAHQLYEKFGFSHLKKPETFMEIYKPDVFLNKNCINENSEKL